MKHDGQWRELKGLAPTRESLLSRLRSWDDEASWTEFFGTYWKLIYATARTAGLSDAEAQDVVQETVISVCKHMPQFHYDRKVGSFKAWLLQLTRWRIRDQLRRRMPKGGEEGATEGEAPAEEAEGESALWAEMADPDRCELESVWETEWKRSLLEAAVERAKRQADPKQFQLFDLYVLQHWPVERICQAFKIGRGRIYLAKFRIAALVRKQVRYLETKWC